MTDRLIVFVKAPRAGQVKTRLARALGPTKALSAYRQMVETVLRSLSSLPGVELCFSPDDAEAEVQPWLMPTWIARPQGAGDLGARMQRAFEAAFQGGAERVVLIGSDSPEVGLDDVQEAWRELRQSDLVIGPATDGGYWLIGLRPPAPRLFQGVPWSTDQVLGETLRRAKEAGLKLHLLRIVQDIDTAADWQEYQARTG